MSQLTFLPPVFHNWSWHSRSMDVEISKGYMQNSLDWFAHLFVTNTQVFTLAKGIWFGTWQLSCGWAFNTSLLTEFLRQTEGFECLIKEAATHDSNSPSVVESWLCIPLTTSPSLPFYSFSPKSPSLSLTFCLQVLSLLFPPAIPLYLLPLFLHFAISTAPPLFSTTFTDSFYLYPAWGAFFLLG